MGSLIFLLIPLIYLPVLSDGYSEWADCTCCDQKTTGNCTYDSTVTANNGLATTCPNSANYYWNMSAAIESTLAGVITNVENITLNCYYTTTTSTTVTTVTPVTKIVTATDKNGNIVTQIVVVSGTTTSASSTTSSPCVDLNDNGICDATESLRCETEYLIGTKFLVVKILCYIAAGWVILWCLLTIIVNIMHKNTGHHRWIHLLEELGIIVLWVFMGVLNLTFRDKSGFCKIISIVIHYFIVMVAGCFVFEAFFANSMAHGKKKKNGSIPAFLNYIIPILLALIPCLVTYFTQKKYYGITGLHCFVFVPVEIFYAYVIPVWILLQIATLKSSLGNLACDMTHDWQDELQCHWAKKSCKMMSFLAYWIFMAYLTCMFGSSQQRLWVLCVFFAQSLFLGPLIFVCHTFVHRNTSRKWYKPSCFGRFYKPCPPRVPPLLPLPAQLTPAPPPSPPAEKPPPPRRGRSPPPPDSPPPYNPPPPPKPLPKAPQNNDSHTRADELWGWATTKGNLEKKDDILFRPRAF